MGLPALSEEQVVELVAEFEETGYVVLPLLTEPEVSPLLHTSSLD
eukprot:COSAG04_NODE_301_length_17421_cov_23.392045_10_plen_45_part_00